MKRECDIARDTLLQRLLIAQITPNKFAYIHGGGKEYTAVLGGEIIYLIQCKPVPVSMRPSDSCFLDIPATYNNESYFMTNNLTLLRSFPQKSHAQH